MKRESWWARLFGREGGAGRAQRPAADEQVPQVPVGAHEDPGAEADSDEETVERRAAARFEVPLGQHDIVRFTMRGKTHESAIEDLSSGGIGFRLPHGEVALAPGSTIPHATIEHNGRRFVVDLHVRSARRVKSFLGGQQLHVGCCFGPLDEAGQSGLEAMLRDLLRGQA